MSKLLVAVFEGISNEYFFDWLDAGLLPGFKRLEQEGFLDRLQCNRIPYEAAGLITAFSGLKDSQHGIIAYFKAYNQEYIPEIWNSSHIKDKMIWNQKKYSDKKFNVINIFGTHPTYPINGNLISFVMQHSLHYCYPNDLIRNLSTKGLDYSQDVNGFRMNKQNDDFYNEIIRADSLRFSVAKELIKQDGDITIVNFTAIERVSHFYIHELKNASLENVKQSKMFQAYKLCDEILNELIDYTYKGNDLIMFSEIGFGHLKSYISINEYLEQNKYFYIDQAETRRPNWNKTVAFESVQGSSGININRKGWYSNGIVSDDEYEQVLDEIIDCLKCMPNPENGDLMFKGVFKSDDFYEGNDLTADIILVPFNEEYLPYGDSYWADIVSRNTQTGWHRSESICGGVGPNISEKVVTNKRDLVDIVPTINYLLGISNESYIGKSWIK